MAAILLLLFRNFVFKSRFDDEGAKAFASAIETLGNHLNGAEHSLAPVVRTECGWDCIDS